MCLYDESTSNPFWGLNVFRGKVKSSFGASKTHNLPMESDETFFFFDDVSFSHKKYSFRIISHSTTPHHGWPLCRTGGAQSPSLPPFWCRGVRQCRLGDCPALTATLLRSSVSSPMVGDLLSCLEVACRPPSGELTCAPTDFTCTEVTAG